ncbi:MptD family putative ECF transporter S component [Atopobium fossor]|uniref:MptD family putative ECF transporter S component n=1 Tax=Atopobium fossor TaxID=39487 RepID=UPI0003FA0D83|nr:MptD family putative ECF transporter S component [Atopobium fossor]
MNTEKLKVKDLVTIGVFAVVYFVVMFSLGMIGMVPILFLIWPTLLGVVAGSIVMLFMAKVPKSWALFIFGMIAPLAMFVGGHTVVVPLYSCVVMLIAEFVRRAGDFKSMMHNIAAAAIFNAWSCGSLFQIFLVHDRYFELTVAQMGVEYGNTLDKLMSYPTMGLIIVGALIGGLIGGFIGKALLKKHFEKAGIV